MFIDFWKLRCQTLLKYQSKIAKVTLGSHCPQKVSARILTVPPQRILCSKYEVKDPGGYMKEEQFGFFKAFVSVNSSDEKRNPA